MATNSSTQSVSRRMFLRGMGVTMALPWLESVSVWGDESSKKDSSDPPVRLACLFTGNGFHSGEWWAKGEGKNMELGKVLESLMPFREKMLFSPLAFNVSVTPNGKGSITNNVFEAERIVIDISKPKVC